jgi:membrane protein implicated in regulation of membrane protease activity
MDFYSTINSVMLYFQTNTYVAILVGLILLFFLVRKPKLFLTIFIIAVVLLGISYLISSVTSIGMTKKSVLINKGR